MEPVTTALLIAGSVALAKKAAEGAAGKVGEAGASKAMEYWGKVKTLLGFQSDPAPEKLEDAVGAAVYGKADIRPELQRLLEDYRKSPSTVLIGSINAVKSPVSVAPSNTGTINQTTTYNEK